MHPERFWLFTYSDGRKVVGRASSLATFGYHLVVAHDFHLAINTHDVRYRECLVREIIENVIYRIL